MAIKNAKWDSVVRTDGTMHRCNNWGIFVNKQGTEGYIIRRKNYTLVEKLKEGQTIAQGAGIPNYVVDKANELIH